MTAKIFKATGLDVSIEIFPTVVLREYNVGDKVVMTVGVDKASVVMINCWNTSKIIFVMSFFVMTLYEVVLVGTTIWS